MAEPETDAGTTATARGAGVRDRLRSGLSTVSPEWTRRTSWLEARTVARLSWDWLVRLNRWLEVMGRVATAAYVIFFATVIFGVDWRDLVEQTLNSGRPVRGAVALVVLLPTLLFVALHSLTGYGRWRVQRELWRRDVERLRRLEAGERNQPRG